MTDYAVTDSQIGAHEKTLAANVVDKVAFADDVDRIRIHKEEGGSIYYTTDGKDPVVGSAACHCLPAGECVVTFDPETAGGTVVKLASAYAVKYSVSRVGR